MSEQDPVTILLLGSDLKEGGGTASVQNHGPPHCHRVNMKDITVICTPDAAHFTDTDLVDLLASMFPGHDPVRGTSLLFYLMVEKGTHVGKWEKAFGKSVSDNINTLNKETRQLLENPLHSHHKTWQSLRSPYTLQQLVEEILSKRKDSLLRPSEISADKYMGDQRLSLVLLGEKGSGKSASGNTILGQDTFRSVLNSKAITIQCEEQSKNIYGIDVKVIDTPDFFDDDLQDKDHALDCSQMCDGVCVYLLVIQIGRFTEGERDILQRLEKALPITRDKTIILFTHGDELGSQNIDQYIKRTNESLQELVSQCGGRCQVFNNRNKKGAEQQRKELMKKIADLVNTTDGVQVCPNWNVEKKTGILSWFQ